MNALAGDPMAGVDFARGTVKQPVADQRRVAAPEERVLLSAKIHPAKGAESASFRRIKEARSETLCTMPAKPTAEMLIAGSVAGGISVRTVAVVYAAMIGKAGAP